MLLVNSVGQVIAGWLIFSQCLCGVVLALKFSIPSDPAVSKLKSLEEFKALFVGGKASTTMMVGIHTSAPDCVQKLEHVAFTGSHRFGARDHLQLYTIPAELFSGRSCACACVAAYKKNADMQTFEFTDQTDYQFLTSWLRSRVEHSMAFTNGFSTPIQLDWRNEGGTPVPQGVLAPGQTTSMRTHLSHIFVATDVSTGEVLDWMTVNGDEGYTFSDANRRQKCVEDDEQTCADTTTALTIFKHQIHYQQRLGLNLVQPALVKPFTATGFEKRRLSELTYQRLKRFHDRHMSSGVEELDVGPCMNQYESPSYMAHLTPADKRALSNDLQPILEQWANTSLALTSVYGIRRYEHGAVLRMHVDTVTTHVISAIINVAQNTTEDWLLEIYDHDGNVHKIPMEPGDLMLYESAKLLHGRPEPLNGEYYANVFIHYKPVSAWEMGWM